MVEPWGTSQSRLKHAESVPLTDIRWLLLDRYGLNQFRTAPCNPSLFCNRLMRISSLIASNAALRSNNTRSVTHFESTASMSFITFNKAFSVVWLARYDECTIKLSYLSIILGFSRIGGGRCQPTPPERFTAGPLFFNNCSFILQTVFDNSAVVKVGYYCNEIWRHI